MKNLEPNDLDYWLVEIIVNVYDQHLQTNYSLLSKYLSIRLELYMVNHTNFYQRSMSYFQHNIRFSAIFA